ncbi:GNAT family N-acetyltransferase [Chelatococcus asaccharovorans]|uniref:GNAT family N-acetyltransferase n=1 Tax=Chelatococcus asaccharovorans TaxID=28210 RepID=UPI00224C7740|nr:GNAT family N-acetyltransferase [Chelatococcus asaccharovorans]CAH1658921.1 Acetyltransferase (GNAT) family protein [Chelatococcus asaccharovorans]CAH1688293.1 Acetyltransferase (GNAT) family protein [Chelatococcus asaccharovorans]
MLPNETGPVEWHRGPYTLSTDRDRLDLDRVHRFLAEESYWARGVPRDCVARSIEGAMSLGLYCAGEQVGFARLVTDCTRLAYLMDVFIDGAHRGQGLGSWLAQAIQTHPDLAGVTRWMLTTVDAHAVYERAGWRPLAHPERMMEVVKPMPRASEAADTTIENRE